MVELLANLMVFTNTACGIAVICFGTGLLVAKLRWHIAWKGGDAREMRRSVRLGWHTGMPPEGEWFFVREYADKAKSRYLGGCVSNYGWALMRRRGDTCYSINGGFTTPATNITGWMYVDQQSIEPSVRNDPPLSDDEDEDEA